MVSVSFAEFRGLSPAEQRDTMMQLATELTDRQIAEQWQVSVSTVRNLRQRFGLRKGGRGRMLAVPEVPQPINERTRLLFELHGESAPEGLKERIDRVLAAMATLGHPVRYSLRFERGSQDHGSLADRQAV